MGENVDTETLVEYEGRRMYPEVAEYFKGERLRELLYRQAAADADHLFAVGTNNLELEAVRAGRFYNRYAEETASRLRELREARATALSAARQARDTSGRDLLLTSPHREVRWIAEHCLFADQGDEVERHAETILKSLPSTQEQLWELAKERHGMCEVFDRFYEQAEAAGVFNGGKPRPGGRELMALRNYIRRDYGSQYVRDFQHRLEPVLKAIEEAHKAELEAAKAEWQQQDAAYAENVRRNRSQAARVVAERRERNSNGTFASIG